jgi:hypothetical protein
MKRVLISLISIVILAIPSLAQENNQSKDADSINISVDSTTFEFGGDYLKMKYLRLKPFKTIYTSIYNDAPTVSLYYGVSNMVYERKNFTSKINNNGIYAVSIGSTDLNKSEASLVDYNNDYLSFSIAERKFNYDQPSNSSNSMDLKHLKLSFMFSDGYGWDLGGNAYFVLFHSSGINWNHLNFYYDNADSASIAGAKIFGKQIRYGRGFAGGAKLFLFKGFALNAEYEQYMVFPRHLFWKDLASWIIEASAQGLADVFINKVIDSSPNITPIIHFLLKNGISYGFYELYKDKMNWPSKTVPPLMTKSYKLGVEFIF